MPWLKMLRGPKPGEVFELRDERITVGRGRKNGIIIHDNEVSREHCVFVRVLDAYELHDLNSTNGTFVNGQQVDGSGWMIDSRCIIEIGDSITLEYSVTAPPISETQEMNAAAMDDGNLEDAYLVVRTISQPEPEIYPLDEMTVNIGRDLNNDIVIPEPEASRNHIRLTLINNQYAIEDLGTLNGTYVNDIRLEDTLLLRPNDVIRIGTSVELLYTTKPKGEEPSHIPSDALPSVVSDEPSTTRVPTNSVKPLAPSTRPTAFSHLHSLSAGQLVDHVFLAYAPSEWSDVAGKLFAYLEDNKIPIWATQGMSPESDDWQLAVNQALAECACLIVILSPKAMETPYVRRAARYFFVREKPVFVLKYQPTENLPMALRNIPAITHDPHSEEHGYRTILAALRKLSMFKT